jgi:hypothetical protein
MEILFNAQRLRLIIGEREVKIYVAVVWWGRSGKRKRQDETRFTTNIVGKKN